MAMNSVAVMQFIGSFWTGAALLGLISTAFFEGTRTFMMSLNLYQHLGVWLAGLVPGVVILLLAERRS